MGCGALVEASCLECAGAYPTGNEQLPGCRSISGFYCGFAAGSQNFSNQE